jgi:kinesin family protein 2/24
MASSAALTTTHLPRLRTLLQDWEQKQLALKGQQRNGSEDLNDSSADGLQITLGDNGSKLSKDVIVAFRTRPPLKNEAADKFKGNPDQNAESGEGGAEIVKELGIEFCAGISVPNSEAGVFIAHVPGMKVGLLCISLEWLNLFSFLVVWPYTGT